MNEFLYIQNPSWNINSWRPFHIKNDKQYKLFYENKFDLMSNDYIGRFSSIIIKILTYD